MKAVLGRRSRINWPSSLCILAVFGLIVATLFDRPIPGSLPLSIMLGALASVLDPRMLQSPFAKFIPLGSRRVALFLLGLAGPALLWAMWQLLFKDLQVGVFWCFMGFALGQSAVHVAAVLRGDHPDLSG